MPDRKLRVERDPEGTLLRFVLDAPPANIIDVEMIASLRAAVVEAASERNLKALVLEGAGSHFSYGASIPEHRPGEIERLLPSFHALFRELLELGCPTIAVVRGQCLGGGLELAAFCNWIFASPDARFGQPEVKLGLFAPIGSLLLPHRVGRSVAEAMCITGRILGAEDALDANLVDHLAEEPGEAADAWIATHLMPLSAVALRHAVRAVRHTLRSELLRDIAAMEQLYLNELMHTEDAREGIRAFLEKRAPHWKNR